VPGLELKALWKRFITSSSSPYIQECNAIQFLHLRQLDTETLKDECKATNSGVCSKETHRNRDH